MGVPVITCPGKTFAGRHSLSHLTNAGFVETVTGDVSDTSRLPCNWRATCRVWRNGGLSFGARRRSSRCATDRVLRQLD